MGGNAFKGSSAVKEGIPWLKITNVGKNGINWNTQFYLPFSFWDKWPNYQLFSGDYVMALTRPVLDHTLKIGKMDRKALLNQRVSKLEFNFDKEFTFQLLQRKKTVIEIEKELAGSDPPNLGSKNLKNIKIFLSIDPDEQKRIGLLFRCLDNLLALYERKVKLLSQVKKYFLDNLFAEKEYPNLRFKGFTDAWEQRKLSEMTQQVKRTSDSENPILTISAKNGWMDQKDRFNRVIAGKELKNYIELYKNELSYNHGNSKYAKFGIIYVQRKYEKALVPKVYHSFSMSYGDPRFIENLSLGHKLDKELSKFITSGARQDGLLNINKKSFYAIKLFIPSEQEQIKISNIMDVINHIITLYEDKQQHLIEIKNTLLNTMFI